MRLVAPLVSRYRKVDDKVVYWAGLVAVLLYGAAWLIFRLT